MVLDVLSFGQLAQIQPCKGIGVIFLCDVLFPYIIETCCSYQLFCFSSLFAPSFAFSLVGIVALVVGVFWLICFSILHYVRNNCFTSWKNRDSIWWTTCGRQLWEQFLILQGSRCILAGDHLQLPPTIQSVDAEKKGLGRTLFERLAGLYGNEVMSMLTVQYRMHELIMNWSSQELYDSKVLKLYLVH